MGCAEKRSPRKVVVAFVEANSPASAVGVARGAEIIAADGVDGQRRGYRHVEQCPYSVDTKRSHSFQVPTQAAPNPQDHYDACKDHHRSSATRRRDRYAQRFGEYLIFNEHITGAEQALIDAVASLRDRNITDLILDLRYNAGGVGNSEPNCVHGRRTERHIRPNILQTTQ